MSVIKVQIDKENLQSANPRERSFFIAMAHLANEINILNKLYFWAGETSTTNQAEENGKTALGLFFIRLLAGKLKEGNELLKKKFFGTSLSKEYEPKLYGEGKEALDYLKKYFGRKNFIDVVRNKYSFHYSPDDIDSILPIVPEELELYVSDEGSANTLYYFAEVLVNRSIINEIDSENDQKGYSKFVHDTQIVANRFAKVADYLIVEFIKKQGKDIWGSEGEEVDFSDRKLITDIELPWFTDTSPLHNEGTYR